MQDYQREIRRKVNAALLLPTILCVLLLAAMSIMAIFVVPQMQAAYQAAGLTVPHMVRAIPYLVTVLSIGFLGCLAYLTARPL